MTKGAKIARAALNGEQHVRSASREAPSGAKKKAENGQRCEQDAMDLTSAPFSCTVLTQEQHPIQPDARCPRHVCCTTLANKAGENLGVLMTLGHEKSILCCSRVSTIEASEREGKPATCIQ